MAPPDHASLPDPLPVQVQGRIDARLRPPGSRSITNRALLIAALAEGTSRLRGVTPSDDTLAMRGGLEAMGIAIRDEADTWVVEGGRLRAPVGTVDVRASGTTARFLTAAAALADGPVRLDGTARMRERPIQDLVDALCSLGAPARAEGPGGCPPVVVEGGGLPGGEAVIDASRSSQFVSGILLAAPCAARDVELRFRDEALVSRSFVELTFDVMTAFGATPSWLPGEAGVRVAATGYLARDFEIEPDAQAAVYPFAAAAITGGRMFVEGLPPHSTQTDLGFLDALAAMGCRVERRADGILVEGAPDGLRGVTIDMNAIPDAVLALAVVALFAEGPTEIRNIAHLRIKESDRLAALETELRRLGADAVAGDDFLRIDPAPLRGTDIATYDDHRMAMSFALAGLRVPGVAIRDPGCVAKTWPDFFDVLGTWHA